MKLPKRTKSRLFKLTRILSLSIFAINMSLGGALLAKPTATLAMTADENAFHQQTMAAAGITFDGDQAVQPSSEIVFDSGNLQFPSDNVFRIAARHDCHNGETRSCGKGICAGIETCNHSGSWGSCVSDNEPKEEICGNGIDENCDGSDLACPEEKPLVTVTATKIVCDDESYLPDWSESDKVITESSATDFINEVNGKNDKEVCHVKSGWTFQWSNTFEENLGDNLGAFTTEAWHSSSPTGDDGKTTFTVDGTDEIRVREAMQDGFLHYSGERASTTSVSPEMWCHNDVSYYDNFDFIFDAVRGEHYYCLAINAPDKAPTCEITNGGIESCNDEIDNDCDGQVNEGCGGGDPVTGLISGHKFNDVDGLGLVAEKTYAPIPDWSINLYKCQTNDSEITPIVCDEAALKTTSTGSDGLYSFSGLADGIYLVSEATSSHWTQTYPVNPIPYIYISAQSPTSENNDFYNHLELYCGDNIVSTSLGEQCDGVSLPNSTCDALCQTIPGGSDGGDGNNPTSRTLSSGGGGGGVTTFNAANSQVPTDNSTCVDGKVSLTMTWLTNFSATSRVLYDTVSRSDAASSTAPNYGYAFSTTEDTARVTGHTVVISGLLPDQPYYFRSVSVDGSKEVKGEEKGPIKTPVCGTSQAASGPIVLGEEGAPVLKITHKSLNPFANPGTKNIDFEITVTNTGNIAAFSTVLTDTLPAGLAFSDNGLVERTWNLGDLAPGQSKKFTVKADAAQNAKLMEYVSIAKASASNHAEVSAPAKIELRGIAVLAATGFSLIEFLSLLLLLSGLIAASYGLKRISQAKLA